MGRDSDHLAVEEHGQTAERDIGAVGHRADAIEGLGPKGERSAATPGGGLVVDVLNGHAASRHCGFATGFAPGRSFSPRGSEHDAG